MTRSFAEDKYSKWWLSIVEIQLPSSTRGIDVSWTERRKTTFTIKLFYYFKEVKHWWFINPPKRNVNITLKKSRNLSKISSMYQCCFKWRTVPVKWCRYGKYLLNFVCILLISMLCSVKAWRQYQKGRKEHKRLKTLKRGRRRMGGAVSKFNLNAFKQRYMFPCSIQISVFYL